MIRFSCGMLAIFALSLFLLPANGQDKLPEKLKITDVKEGTGPAAKKGDVLVVHYIGKFKDGKKFDSSLDKGEPFEFKLGEKNVIDGWDLGLVGMKAGGLRKLVIPPELAYGEKGRPGVPPNAELHFDVELVKIK